VHRRARAWRLVVENGHSIADAARIMRVPYRRVELFVALERDRREVQRHRGDSIPTERLRAFIDAEFARDPGLTPAELAHRLGMAEIDLLRQFGYAAQKKSNGAKGERVGVATASRVVIALGRAPHELEGC
jgi:hypothetical protein